MHFKENITNHMLSNTY